MPEANPGQWRIEGNATSDYDVISGWLTFETAISRGQGHIRLKDGKCWTLLTTMTELKGFEEKKGASRAKGVQHGAFPNRQTWLERKAREAAELGVTKQPYCLIIGGGQGGIVLGLKTYNENRRAVGFCRKFLTELSLGETRRPRSLSLSFKIS